MARDTQKQKVLDQMTPGVWYFSEQLQGDSVGRSSAFRLSELLKDGSVVAMNSPEAGNGKRKLYMLAPSKEVKVICKQTAHPFLGCPHCKGQLFETAFPVRDLYCKACDFLLSSIKNPKQ